MSGDRGRLWGWHRLDGRWAQRVVQSAGIQPGDLVLDLGAGTGALTGPLLAAGARVVAVELHPARAERLRSRFARQPVRVLQGDMLRLRLPFEPFRVVANPPYAISAQLLRRLLGHAALTAADLVLPRPLVYRYVHGWPPRGARGAQRHCPAAGLHLPATAFAPAASTDAAVLVIRRAATRRR